MLRRLFLILCLIAIPLVTQAQVENLILNPSFEDETDVVDDQWVPNGWVTWGAENGLNSVVEFDENELIDGTRSLRVEPKGAVNWHFMVIYYPMTQSVGDTYTVSFWSKAEASRPISAKIKATDNSVDVIVTDFALTTEWKEYTFTYEAGTADIKLEIWVSGSDVPLWLDFVYLYEGDYVADILPSEAVSPVNFAGKLSVRWANLKLTR